MNGKLLLVACLLALCLTVPTLAVSLETEAETDESLVLESTSPYATINSNDDTGEDELELDLAQLNDEAVTNIDGLFDLTVHDESVRTVELESDVLTFYESGDRTPITEMTPLALETGDTASVGVVVDTAALESDHVEASYTIAVEIADNDVTPQSTGPEIQLTDVTVAAHGATTDVGTESGGEGEGKEEVEVRGEGGREGEREKEEKREREQGAKTEQQPKPGEPLIVTAVYENTGDTTGSKQTTLYVNETIVDTGSVTVDPGATNAFQFEWHPHSSGPLEIGIGDGDELLYSQTVIVGEDTNHAPELTVVETVLESDAVDPGEETTVRATVSNTGTETGTFMLGLAVGGLVVDDRSVSLKPGEQTTVELAFSMNEPGTYDLTVADEPAGTVTVSDGDGHGLTPLGVTKFATLTILATIPTVTLALFLVWSGSVGRITSVRSHR
ncbi:CARDB domain-containing protein [Natrialba chahannaoensis]|nr:CARDB domain-containing protein [Natrialba chahannaoensis]